MNIRVDRLIFVAIVAQSLLIGLDARRVLNVTSIKRAFDATSVISFNCTCVGRSVSTHRLSRQLIRDFDVWVPV